MLEPDADKHEIIERVAALDIGKATLVRRTRIPGQGRSRAGSGGHRALDDDPSLQLMIDRLLELGVTRG